MQLKLKGMRATVKFIGAVHFTFGVVVGVECAGNGKGRHAGDVDKIRYFETKRNSGLFVRVEEVGKVLEKGKKLKSTAKSKSMDKATGERLKMLCEQKASKVARRRPMKRSRRRRRRRTGRRQ